MARIKLFAGGLFRYTVTEKYPDGHTVVTYKEAGAARKAREFLARMEEHVIPSMRKGRERDFAYSYMKSEAAKTWSPAYMKYFDEWFSNCSDYQIRCFLVWREGRMGMFTEK